MDQLDNEESSSQRMLAVHEADLERARRVRLYRMQVLSGDFDEFKGFDFQEPWYELGWVPDESLQWDFDQFKYEIIDVLRERIAKVREHLARKRAQAWWEVGDDTEDEDFDDLD